ncbi:MAG: hypothetical protein LBU36_04430 [Clostridiales bacterium]|jgi:hypothetical protein|nr:hypothetical protein [Clostridiales bacterium]
MADDEQMDFLTDEDLQALLLGDSDDLDDLDGPAEKAEAAEISEEALPGIADLPESGESPEIIREISEEDLMEGSTTVEGVLDEDDIQKEAESDYWRQEKAEPEENEQENLFEELNSESNPEYVLGGAEDEDPLLKELNSDAMPTIAVFGPEEKKAKGPSLLARAAAYLAAIPLRTKYRLTAAIIVLMLLVVSGVEFITWLNRLKIPKGAKILTLNEDARNTANYMYTNDEIMLNGKETRVQKILTDSQATRIYLEKPVLIGNMDAVLLDNDGNTYHLSLLSHYNGELSDTLTFEPFPDGVTSFTLLPRNQPYGYLAMNASSRPRDEEEEEEDGKKPKKKAVPTELTYYFNKRLYFSASKHINNINLRMLTSGAGEADAVFRIEDAAFTSAGTFIDYSVLWDPEKYANVSFYPAKGKESGFLRIYENGGFLAARKTNARITQTADGVMTGRLEYRPLSEFESKLSFKITGLEESVALNRELDADGLFEDNPENEIRIPAGGNTVVIERMGKGQTIYVAVAHAEDADGRRVYADYDFELAGRNAEGSPVTLSPQVFSSPEGADIVFSDPEGQVVFLSPADIKLRVRSVRFPVSASAADFSLEFLDNGENPRAKAARRYLEAAFLRENGDCEDYTAQVAGISVDGADVSAVVYEAGVKNGEAFTDTRVINAKLSDAGLSITGYR